MTWNSTKKMNLVFMPISVFNGMAGTMRLQNLITYLLEYPLLSISNFIITNQNSDKGNSVLSNKVSNQVFLFDLKRPFLSLKYFFSIIKQLFKYYKKDQNNLIYHYGYPSIKNILLLVIIRILGYKLIFDIVEDNTKIEKYKSILSKIKVRSSIFLFNHLYWFADGAIGISQHLVETLKKVSLGKFPVIHIPITINPSIFEKNDKFSNTKTGIEIFYGGSFGEKDGLKFMLKAFDEIAKLYPNVSMKLSGKGLKRDMDKFYHLFDQVKFKSRIEYLGYISYEDYIYHLKGADILCMTRNSSSFANAGFPFKLGEMLATGKPVVVSNVGDVNLYLENRVNALVINPESVDLIVNAIKYIINNKEDARKIGDNGKSTSMKYFNSELHSLELLKFITSEVFC